MAQQTPTQRKAAARKAAATRKRNAARRRTQNTQRPTAQAEPGAVYAVQRGRALATQAERVALIPVGAALVARDNVLEAVVDATRPYTRSRESAERELEKLARR